MPLTLLAGPANSGKVAALLDRYLASIDEDPVLIVPNRADVDRIERDLLERSPALLGGSIGTFADLFEGLARSDPAARPVATEALRALVVRRVLSRARLNGLGRSARFQGFSDSLAGALGELESGLLDPADLEDEDLAGLYASYRDELGGSASGTVTTSGGTPPLASPATSRPGTGDLSSLTASRT